MSKYNLEVYSIQDSTGKILYVGRRTPDENRSKSRCLNMLNAVKRRLQTDDLEVVSEGIFDNVKDALACIKHTELRATLPRTPVEAPISTVRKRAIKTTGNGHGRTNHFIDFTWNEKAQTYFTIEIEDPADYQPTSS